ncbi:hypothetical protein CABS03_10416 [Colletotrichum abscissum]
MQLDRSPRRTTTRAATCREEQPVGCNPARNPGTYLPATTEGFAKARKWMPSSAESHLTLTDRRPVGVGSAAL